MNSWHEFVAEIEARLQVRITPFPLAIRVKLII